MLFNLSQTLKRLKMYSNLTNGEHSGGDGYDSTPHASPSTVGSEPTLQHGQSMDSVAGAGEDEVSCNIKF